MIQPQKTPQKPPPSLGNFKVPNKNPWKKGTEMHKTPSQNEMGSRNARWKMMDSQNRGTIEILNINMGPKKRTIVNGSFFD